MCTLLHCLCQHKRYLQIFTFTFSAQTEAPPLNSRSTLFVDHIFFFRSMHAGAPFSSARFILVLYPWNIFGFTHTKIRMQKTLIRLNLLIAKKLQFAHQGLPDHVSAFETIATLGSSSRLHSFRTDQTGQIKKSARDLVLCKRLGPVYRYFTVPHLCARCRPNSSFLEVTKDSLSRNLLSFVSQAPFPEFLHNICEYDVI